MEEACENGDTPGTKSAQDERLTLIGCARLSVLV
jgi:hypothetical protein